MAITTTDNMGCTPTEVYSSGVKNLAIQNVNWDEDWVRTSTSGSKCRYMNRLNNITSPNTMRRELMKLANMYKQGGVNRSYRDPIATGTKLLVSNTARVMSTDSADPTYRAEYNLMGTLTLTVADSIPESARAVAIGHLLMQLVGGLFPTDTATLNSSQAIGSYVNDMLKGLVDLTL